MINIVIHSMICCFKPANRLTPLLAPQWCSSVEMEQNSYLSPDPDPFSAKPPERCSMISPARWHWSHPSPTYHMQTPWFVILGRHDGVMLGNWTLAPALLVLLHWKGFLFFFWYVTVWQMFLMDLTVVRPRKSEFLPFGFDTEHIPLIAQVPFDF